MKSEDQRVIFRVVSIYVVFSAAWIFLSDRLLDLLFLSPPVVSEIQTIKGWLFVLASAILIGVLLFAEQRRRQVSEARLAQSRTLFEASQEESQRQVSESRVRLLAAVENVPFDFWMMDAEGCYIMQNPSCREHWGDLIGKRNQDLLLPGDLLAKWERINQQAREKGRCQEEITYLAADGMTHEELVIVSPVAYREGKSGLLGVNIDISAIKQRERDLRAMVRMSEELRSRESAQDIFRILMDHIQEQPGVISSIILIQPATGDPVIVEYAHGPWRTLTGQTIAFRRDCQDDAEAALPEQITVDGPDNPLAFLKTSGIQAAVALPLACQDDRYQGLLVGSLSVLEQGRLDFLLVLVKLVDAALQRESLNRQKEQHLQRLTTLRSINLAINASLDVRLTLSMLLNQVVPQLGVDAGVVLLYSPITQTLDYSASRGFDLPALRDVHLRLGEGYAGEVALDRKVIAVSNLMQESHQLSGFLRRIGANYSSYIGAPLISRGEVKGVLELFSHQALSPDPEWFDFLQAVTTQAAIAIDNAELFDRLQRSNTDLTIAYDATIEGWARALEFREQESEGHTQRVTDQTLKLARQAGFPEEELIHLRRGVLLHDIGKMSIPDRILLKPGPLSSEEWELMKLHPRYAYEMLAPIPYLRPAVDIPYCHHERWDGSGYPRGLSGEQIPRSARIFAVIDVWDALATDRPDRPAWPEKRILEYLRDEAGKTLDSHVVELFLENYPQDGDAS